ncbi:MAG: hypothetical protein SFV54_13440 [Bryobacteraceae bacterium]|nr:hypothetical protein [Bryobacteraceae bacterium]
MLKTTWALAVSRATESGEPRGGGGDGIGEGDSQGDSNEVEGKVKEAGANGLAGSAGDASSVSTQVPISAPSITETPALSVMSAPRPA